MFEIIYQDWLLLVTSEIEHHDQKWLMKEFILASTSRGRANNSEGGMEAGNRIGHWDITFSTSRGKQKDQSESRARL